MTNRDRILLVVVFLAIALAPFVDALPMQVTLLAYGLLALPGLAAMIMSR